ncbi:hypothetical protein U1Q18_015103, partial [Sarracenia purpurea var. burkii]
PKNNTLDHYQKLYIASVQGDWEKADRIISDAQWPGIVTAQITKSGETSLMVAVRSERRNRFVENLLRNMEEKDLKMTDKYGMTALHSAVLATNLEATKMLVGMCPDLPNIADHKKLVPLHVAAKIGNREMVIYLLDVTKEEFGEEPKPFEHGRGAKLLSRLAYSGHYDIAVEVLRRYPNVVALNPVLAALATKRSAFRSGTKLNIWERLLYCC